MINSGAVSWNSQAVETTINFKELSIKYWGLGRKFFLNKSDPVFALTNPVFLSLA